MTTENKQQLDNALAAILFEHKTTRIDTATTIKEIKQAIEYYTKNVKQEDREKIS